MHIQEIANQNDNGTSTTHKGSKSHLSGRGGYRQSGKYSVRSSSKIQES